MVPEQAQEGMGEAQTAVWVARDGDGKTAILEAQNGGQRDRRHPLGFFVLSQARLEAQPLRHAHDIVCSALPVAKAAIVLELCGIGGDPEMARDERQRGKP